ncbi:hypothetical protein FLT15_04140 [Paenibacillus thiaminolyticus]|uniref:PIG-L deacetylase family protein n=1 Tax=Paenibacillus thiaminolyticus TaxID=49283 RepID=UPI0011639765|nr:PIG-L family deacetylase [Paenibacillus thiaminolyticus]NGP57604.1 hypothetical protein [Paenibacillus thiaminolyticus]
MNWLVISPHPDDAEYGASGLICGLNELGENVTILCFVPSFEFGEPESFSKSKQRVIESEESAKLLNCNLVWMEGNLSSSKAELVSTMTSIFKELQVDIVITVYPNDRHPFHEYVTNIVEQAVHLSTLESVKQHENFPSLKIPPLILYMEAFTTIEASNDFLINVTPWFIKARKSLLLHKTGLEVCPALEHQMKISHMSNGLKAGVLYAEGFKFAKGYGQEWVSSRNKLYDIIVKINNMGGEVL